MAKRRRRKGRKAARRWSLMRIVKVSLTLGILFGGAVLALLGFYFYELNREITETFEGRRWSLPMRVYAAPIELYPGAKLGLADLAGELDRLGYRRGKPNRPGQYRTAIGTINATLRTFRFEDGTRPASRLTITFDGDTIRSLQGPDGTVSAMRLEPPLIGSFFASHGEDRMVIEPRDTPPLLVETLKAVEDRKFDTHPGFDPVGILRAAWVNLRAGEITQGASTLTQQLVRSYYLTNRQTYRRKLREIAMAMVLERRFTKEDIMNAYINEIHLGQEGSRAIHGFGLGSLYYFNKPLAELDDHEIALLVAVIRGPSYYNPFRHPERVRARRDRILETMATFGLIDRDRLARALASDLGIATNRTGGQYYPAFMDIVRRELKADYDADTLTNENLTAHTTLDPRLQDRAQRAVARTLDGLEKNRGIEAGTLEAAMVIRDSQTGDLRAVVGGRAGRQGFNRALNARRQVGSLVKPMLYLLALESGRFHLASIIDDAPITFPDHDDWSPRNFDGEYHGEMPLVRALGDSVNVASVRLGSQIGIDAVADRIHRLTGQKPLRYPSLFLGAAELTPLEVSNLYAMLASGGFNTPPKSVIAVTDARGNTLSRYPLEIQQIVAAETVATLNAALQVAMSHGTGRSSKFARRGIAGKTGTTTAERDSWFVGYDGARIGVTWIGRDDNASHGLTGSSGALRLWDAFMANDDITPLMMRGIEFTTIDYETGLRVREGCGEPVDVALPSRTRVKRLPNCRRR